MPTPHGSRGGMAFSADELRVVRRALAEALHPVPVLPSERPQGAGPGPSCAAQAPPLPVRDPGWNESVQEYVRLAEAVEEAAREAGRMRAFMLAELRRYREALPGAAGGYLLRLTDALAGGYLPTPDDLAALRALRLMPCAAAERARRADLLARCQELAELEVRARLSAPRRRERVPVPPTAALGGLGRSRAFEVLLPRASGEPATPKPPAPKPPAPKAPAPKGPAPKTPAPEPTTPKTPAPKAPAPKAPAPNTPAPGKPEPERPRTPTPAEIWPPRRKPAPPRKP